MNAIESRVPYADYAALDAINISRLKELRRSPQHFRYSLKHPKVSDPMTLGTATHVAVLEPERFASQFAIWSNRTDAGKMSPRNGKTWDAFRELHAGRTIITIDEATEAQAIAAAVRSNVLAMKYLAAGEPEVSMQWLDRERLCKGRIDWLTHIDGKPYLVGLKTARDCRHFAFGSQAAKLGYHLQFSWYADGYHAITGKNPSLVEIVVENTAPYAVAVYRIGDDILAQGHDEYVRLLELLEKCESTGEWPGPAPVEEDLTLPSWVYGSQENDLADLGLEAA